MRPRWLEGLVRFKSGKAGKALLIRTGFQRHFYAASVVKSCNAHLHGLANPNDFLRPLYAMSGHLRDMKQRPIGIP
jgi:hypothetical protein